MTGRETLQRAIIKFVYERRPSKADIIGEFAKAPSKRDRNPEWMSEPLFDGVPWLELMTHERKYWLRMNINPMTDAGYLKVESKLTISGQYRNRYKVGSVLDRLAAIKR